MMFTEAYWKSEHMASDGVEVGPLTMIDGPARDADPEMLKASQILPGSIPFGYEPDWRWVSGWITEAEAKRMAAAEGIDRLGPPIRSNKNWTRS